MTSALESFSCRRWRSKPCRKPRAWHGKRIRCCGRNLVEEQRSVELPITDVDLKAKVIHDCALQVTLTQTFQHNFHGFQFGPLTVSYIFPLESTSVVYSMRATLSSGVEIEGLIKEKEEAKQEFIEAVQQGDTAVLMSQVDGDVFQFDVGNVDPGESIKITVSYVTTLEYDDRGNIRFFIPRSITPRFGATDLRALGVTRINYNMSVFVDITTYGRLVNVQCTSHPHSMRCTRDFNNDRHMTITFNLPVDSDGMDSDLEALITQEEVTQTHAVYEYSNIFKTHAFMISFVAQPMDEERDVEGVDQMTIDEAHSGVELVFLVDRSGSMAGSRMETVKRTLKKLLRSMPQDCKFNMISFSDSENYFQRESVVYNDESFGAADEWIDRLTASGGTQLYSALNSVLSAGYDPLRARNIFVLTDGAVSNTRECIRLVDRVGENVRVFTFGIGSGHSTELVNGLAQAGNGIATSIADLNDIGTKVMTALNHALQPVIGNLNVMIQSPPNEGSPLKFDIFPRKMPALFYGRQTIFYAVAHESVQLSRDLGLSVSVTGIQNGHKPYQMNIPIDLSPFSDEGEIADPGMFADYFADGDGMIAPAAGEEMSHFGQPRDIPKQLQIIASRSKGLVIHRLAAKARIQELEHSSSDLKKQEIVTLAMRFNLVSSETSLIAVHRDREGRSMGEKMINKSAIENEQEQQQETKCRYQKSIRSRRQARRTVPDRYQLRSRPTPSVSEDSLFGVRDRDRDREPVSKSRRYDSDTLDSSWRGGHRTKRSDEPSRRSTSHPSNSRFGGRDHEPEKRSIRAGGSRGFEQRPMREPDAPKLKRFESSRKKRLPTSSRFSGSSRGFGRDPPDERRSTWSSARHKSDAEYSSTSPFYSQSYSLPDTRSRQVSDKKRRRRRDRPESSWRGGSNASRNYADATTNCICGAKFQCVPIDEVYDGNEVICDECEQKCTDDVVYHCPRGQNSVHEEGYDLCPSCAVKPIPFLSLDKLTNLYQGNGSFGLEVLLYGDKVPLLDDVMEEHWNISMDKRQSESVRATLVGLVLLRQLFSHRVGEWKLMERKSLKYVGECMGETREVVVSWIERLCQ